MIKPSLKILCDTRDHCPDCRARTPAGDAFRASLAQHYAVPADFPECPFGVEWDATQTPSAATPPPALPAALAPGSDWKTTQAPHWWARFHRLPFAGAPDDFAAELAKLNAEIPCGECKSKWLSLLAAHPPPAGGSIVVLFNWGVDRHDEVSRQIGKEPMGRDAAWMRWAEGSDG
jgi:hypothetical protein